MISAVQGLYAEKLIALTKTSFMYSICCLKLFVLELIVRILFV